MSYFRHRDSSDIFTYDIARQSVVDKMVREISLKVRDFVFTFLVGTLSDDMPIQMYILQILRDINNIITFKGNFSKNNPFLYYIGGLHYMRVHAQWMTLPDCCSINDDLNSMIAWASLGTLECCQHIISKHLIQVFIIFNLCLIKVVP